MLVLMRLKLPKIYLVHHRVVVNVRVHALLLKQSHCEVIFPIKRPMLLGHLIIFLIIFLKP
jgi:hypothetical protein